MLAPHFSETDPGPRLAISMTSSAKSNKVLPLISSKVKLSPRKLKSKPVTFPKMQRSTSLPSRNYRYKILPGNNSRVIMMALKNRPWWHAILGNDEDFLSQSPTLLWEMYRNSKRYKDNSHEGIMLNHLQRNSCLVTKKGIYLTMKAHCLKNNLNMDEIIPKTFYLASGTTSKSMKDDDLEEFLAFNTNRAIGSAASSSSSTGANNNSDDATTTSSAATVSATGGGIDKQETIWIMKPASKTNRGFGIKVIRGEEAVLNLVNRSASACSRDLEAEEREAAKGGVNGNSDEGGGACCENVNNPLTKAARRAALQDGWIVQLYMERPLLVSGRKFDIRCYVLVTHSQKKGLKGYFYREAYVRTSSKKYSLDKISDRETHLTNDAVQKLSKTYGKFENGNKLSFDEWQALVNVEYPHAPPNVVRGSIFPEIRRLSQVSLQAAAEQLSQSSINKSFELFGYDYMVTEQFQPILIEVNTNPCLEFVCPLLTELITGLIENTMRIAVDPEFPPPSATTRTKATAECIELIDALEQKFDPIFPVEN